MDALVLLLGAALVYLAVRDILDQPRRRAMPEPEPEPLSDRDPGDEDPAPALLPASTDEVQWCMCPRNHVAHLRPRDQAVFCETCSEVYYAAKSAATFLPYDQAA